MPTNLILSTCNFIKFYVKGHFINLPFHQNVHLSSVISSTCHFNKFIFVKCHFINLPFQQIPFRQLAISWGGGGIILVNKKAKSLYGCWTSTSVKFLTKCHSTKRQVDETTLHHALLPRRNFKMSFVVYIFFENLVRISC